MKSIKITLTLLLFSEFLSAHVPFLKPNQFHVVHSRFQIESAFTEFPFQADFVMDAPSFQLINPFGSSYIINSSLKTKAAIYLQPALEADGTYHIHAATRKGPKYRALETADGKLYFAEDTLKYKGAKTHLQYFNSADTYVYKGEKTNYKPTPLNKGLEIIPLTSPNQLYLNTQLTLQGLMDGKPMPDARVVVVYDNEKYEYHRKGDLYDVENIRKNNIYTDKNGNFTFHPQKTGIMMLFVTIHKKINTQLWESYNSSLTMEVILP